MRISVYLHAGNFLNYNYQVILLLILGLFCATAQQSYCRHGDVHRSPVRSFVGRQSVRPVFSETRGINIELSGKVPTHYYISLFYFLTLK